MKKHITIFLIILFPSIALEAQTMQHIPASDSKIQYFGRVNDSDPNNIEFAFPGVSIKANFTGTGISAIFIQNGGGGITTTNYFTVIINNNEPFTLAIKPSQIVYSLAENLPNGVHTIEIFKRTESSVGKITFQGFYIDNGHSLVEPDILPNIRIEFIGNSITCGYGNESSQNPPKSGFSSINQNNYMAWGAITARNLNAQYSCIAYSGRGLYQNNTGSKTGTLPLIYDHVIADESSVIWDNTRFIPDILVINLGTNDFAAEASSSLFTVDSTEFVNTYIAFIEKLRGYYPDAVIICALGVMMNDYYPAGKKHWTRIQSYTTAVVTHFNNIGDELIHYFKMNPQLAPYGEDWHPTIKTHKHMATQLTNFINSINAANKCKGRVSIGENLIASEIRYPLDITTQEEEHIDVTYTWYKNGEIIQNINQPYFTLLDKESAIGHYRVVKDSAGCKYQDKIMVYKQAPSSISKKNYNNIEIIAYKNFYTIHSEIEIDKFEIFDLEGRCVYKKDNINQKIIDINLSNLNKSVYIIKISTSLNEYYRKIIL